jgi:tetratricopeptide (TPR) repeat protein
LKIEIQSELALRYYNQVATKEPDSVLAKVLLAKSYAAGFQPAHAISEYQEVLKQRPDMPEVHLALGELYGDQLHWPAAIDEYRAELSLDPENGMALALLGHAYAEAHDPDAAIKVLNKVLERYPRDAKALADLGKAWSLKGDLAKATDAYERALSCDRTQYELHYRLFQVYRSAGKQVLARKHLEAFQAATAKQKRAKVIVDK